MEKEVQIPDGFEAKIEGNKVIFVPKESYDEKVRKILLRCCDDWDKGQLGLMAKEDVPAIRAYLEKQKEQKPAEKPDLVVQLKEHFANTPKEQLEKEWKELEPWGNIGPTVQEFLYGKPAEWSEEDRKMLDSIINVLEVMPSANFIPIKRETMIPWLESLSERFSLQPKQELSEEDERMRQTAIEACKTIAEKYELSGDRFYKCKDWLEYRLKSLRPQPKKEWSEEDERDNFDILLSMIEASDSIPYIGGHLKLCNKMKSELKTFLKSIRPQPHWKPSEEQIEALEHFVRSWGESGTMSPQNPTLCAAESLLNDLKKL